ncbi:MAG TPA: hypothetical protein VFM13_01480 [Gaiellaceae bacterium]|nr:hypothetical protein [Gaiellaceae bacterium]
MSIPSSSTLPEPLKRRQDEAEVAKAEADARKAEADADKAKVEAEKAAAAADRERLTALVPDLAKVKESTLDVKDTTPMWGTFLTFAAVRKVGAAVADVVLATRPEAGDWRVLITDEAELATSDAVHQEVTTGLEQLKTAAEGILEQLKTAADEKEATKLVGPVVASLASALPGVLSLFSSRRTVSTAATAASDLAAAAAVADALRRPPEVVVVHDDFRLFPENGEKGVYAILAEVADLHQKLVAKKLEFSDAKSTAEVELAKAKAAEHPDEAAIAKLTKDVRDAATRLGLVDSVITAIDTFAAAIRVVPAGATRSSLTTAALRDALHDQKSRFHFTHVLLLKAQAGQAQQQLDNRPFFFKDRFSTVADTSMTYALIETAQSTIVASGTVTGTASARGNIGEPPTVDRVVID